MTEPGKPLGYASPSTNEPAPPNARFDYEQGWQRLAEPAGKRGRSASTAVQLAAAVLLVVIAIMMLGGLIYRFSH